jgi:hypothetical protein
VVSGNAAFITTTFANPHAGVGYSYYGADANGTGINNGTGGIYQTVAIPSSSTSATLRFWLSISTQETIASVFDRLFVEVLNSSGALLSTLATYSNLDSSFGVYSEKVFDLTAFKGQTVRIQFRVSTDISLPTVFRVDDVSLKSDG